MTLPLVHIHPDADHAHGMPGHVHGGTYHTILLNTPVSDHQDQEQHQHDDFFSPENAFGSSQFPSHPLHGFEEATYGFSVIKPFIDSALEKSVFPPVLVSIKNVDPLSAPVVSNLNFTPTKRLVSIQFKTLSPRAPPVFSF